MLRHSIHPRRAGVKLGLNHREREELLGGLRSVPLRLLPALMTTALLFLSGDMVGAWPLAWVALAPLCFACRGAGAPGAFLLAVTALLPSAVLQSLWLLDVEGSDPVAIWLTMGVLTAVPFLAIELPATRAVPWALRPLLVALLATGFWFIGGQATFGPSDPVAAHFLIPSSGLIDSELVRFAYPRLGLASFAGLLTGLGWLAAEMFFTPRRRGQKGWPGIAVLLALLTVAGADWFGSTVKPKPVGAKAQVRVYVSAGNGAIHREIPGEDAVVVWSMNVADAEQRVDWIARAGELAQRRRASVVLMLNGPDTQRAYLFLKHSEPVAEHSWRGGNEPLIVEGEQGGVIAGAGRIRIFPKLTSPEHWSTMWDVEFYLTTAEPAHPAQLRGWLREQRREALIRGSRQVCTWAGGAAAIDGQGRVLAYSEGEPFTVLLPAGEERGQPLGRARLTVVERILALAAPVLAAMLVVLTPLRWARVRRRSRGQSESSLAIEEVADDETVLSKEQTESITRRYDRGDQDG